MKTTWTLITAVIIILVLNASSIEFLKHQNKTTKSSLHLLSDDNDDLELTLGKDLLKELLATALPQVYSTISNYVSHAKPIEVQKALGPLKFDLVISNMTLVNFAYHEGDVNITHREQYSNVIININNLHIDLHGRYKEDALFLIHKEGNFEVNLDLSMEIGLQLVTSLKNDLEYLLLNVRDTSIRHKINRVKIDKHPILAKLLTATNVFKDVLDKLVLSHLAKTQLQKALDQKFNNKNKENILAIPGLLENSFGVILKKNLFYNTTSTDVEVSLKFNKSQAGNATLNSVYSTLFFNSKCF